MKIETLTKEQEAAIIPFREKWIKRTLRTEKTDEEIKQGVKNLYKTSGEKEPIVFIMDSPFGAQVMVNFLRNLTKEQLEEMRLVDIKMDNIGDNIESNIWNNIESNIRNNIGDNIRINIGDNIRDNIWNNLRANLDANLWDNLSANLRDNLSANLWGNLRANLWDNIRDNLRTNLSDNLGVIKAWDYFAGNLWCSWEVFYDFCNEIGVPYSQENRHLLDMWLTQSRECHFWWPYENMVFLSERPASVNVDSQGRLHCENDAALYYHDGYGLYMWHGVRVPKWVITEKELITPEKIFAEQNAEVRRIMTEIYGFRKFGDDLIKSGKAKLVDEKTVWDETVKYYHYNDGDATMGFVHVINGTVEADGTKHEFILTVKADNNNAEQAVLSTYPDLMERIGSRPDKWEIIRKSIRS